MTKRAIVAAVQLSSVKDLEFEASLAELRQLAKTLGFEAVATFTQKRAGFDKTAYFGTGKREELRLLREETSAELILIDHEISPSQMFNLEKEVGGEVMDRTMVILEIFHRHARSRTARAQVEIARLGYMAPRMREAAKQAGPKDRARSGTGGGRGGGAHGALGRRQTRGRRAQRRRVARRARPAQDPRPHGRAAEGARRDHRRARDAARAAPGAPGARPGGARRLHQRRQVNPHACPHRQRSAGGGQAFRHARYNGA